jgi:F0F1-type ATP synthase assembly protein I
VPPFLTYEPKDVVITIGAFIYHPLAGLAISLVVCLVEMVTISDTGIIGFLMNFLSSAVFVGVASVIYYRKKTILRAIVESYIATAEPVGSKAVAELTGLTVSSATIRNDMADLTEMGYLEQPHTSAGRIPSPKGYRVYVNELMDFVSSMLSR